MFYFFGYSVLMKLWELQAEATDKCFICSLILAQYSPFNTNFLLHSQWNCTKSGSILFYELFHCTNTFNFPSIFQKSTKTTKNINKLFPDLPDTRNYKKSPWSSLNVENFPQLFRVHINIRGNYLCGSCEGIWLFFYSKFVSS